MPVRSCRPRSGTAATCRSLNIQADVLSPAWESQFKTLKYRSGFPDRFGSIEDARAFCQDFFPWYNGEHRHSGIGLLTPETVHYGKAELATSHRQLVLASAFDAHQERLVRGTATAAIRSGLVNKTEDALRRLR